jgi:preprotein translocase subunit YajC
VIEPFVAASSAPLFLIVLLALFVFLFILPQRRRQRAQQERLSSVDVGDEVLTVGGLIGRVVETDDAELKVEIADGIVVRISRRAVSTVLHPEEEHEEDEEAYAEDEDAGVEADDGADEAVHDGSEPEAPAGEEKPAEPK